MRRGGCETIGPDGADCECEFVRTLPPPLPSSLPLLTGTSTLVPDVGDALMTLEAVDEEEAFMVRTLTGREGVDEGVNLALVVVVVIIPPSLSPSLTTTSTPD